MGATRFVVIYMIAAWFFSLWPLDDTERAVEASQFNVFFYYPGGKEEYIGVADGLGMCRANARWYANSVSQRFHDNAAWSYICCRIKGDSKCQSKHK